MLSKIWRKDRFRILEGPLYLCHVLKSQNRFWFATAIILSLALVWLLSTPGVSPTLWANSHHSYPSDWFFFYYSKIAEWPVVVAALVLSFLYHTKLGFLASAAYALEGLGVNLIKTALNRPRPLIEAGVSQLHSAHGEVFHSWHSFPSGHTAAAVMGFGLMAMLTPNRWLQASCAVLAFLVGYSRMYLGQHYLRDVMAGATFSLLILAAYQFLAIRFKWLNSKPVS